MTRPQAPSETKIPQPPYRAPAVLDQGRVEHLTKDRENGTKGEPFDITLVWGN